MTVAEPCLGVIHRLVVHGEHVTLALQFRVVVNAARPVGKGSIAVRDREEALLLFQTCVAGSTGTMMTT